MDHNIYLPEADRVDNDAWCIVGAQQMLILAFTQLPTWNNFYILIYNVP